MLGGGCYGYLDYGGWINFCGGGGRWGILGVYEVIGWVWIGGCNCCCCFSGLNFFCFL